MDLEFVQYLPNRIVYQWVNEYDCDDQKIEPRRMYALVEKSKRGVKWSSKKWFVLYDMKSYETCVMYPINMKYRSMLDQKRIKFLITHWYQVYYAFKKEIVNDVATYIFRILMEFY
jgi:hypothetical protein